MTDFQFLSGLANFVNPKPQPIDPGPSAKDLASRLSDAPGATYWRPIWYRDYRIYMGDNWPGARWCYVHDDYDGPEDGRCGYADSIEECKSDIDWREDENAIDEQLWAEQAARNNP